ncbi:MAG: isoamylase early set domain-containing protein [Saprospiraceae bacterium]|nr:isoamylase early set domain-containing protein [Saprospiraceae bacterium]
MATKKVSAKTVVAEKAEKTTKAAPVAKKVAAEKTTKTAPVAADKTTKKTTAPVAEKAAPKVAPVAKVTFVLPKEAVENAETVAVLGDFNNWQDGVLLKKQKDGSFKATVELEKGRSYEYRFLIDGAKWENAWNAEAYKPTPFGVYNCVVTA